MKAEPLINFHNGDCLAFMRGLPDKAYNLAIVDPPYGIGAEKGTGDYSKAYFKGDKKQWDNKTPSSQYFAELQRVSKNQIIWGGNYFQLPPCRGFIIWYKSDEVKGRDFSECEYAWSSFQLPARHFTEKPFLRNNTRIHPTQKPVALYKWLLQNYAKPGDKILDTHGGSMSIAIAAYDLGFDLDICEIDADYFRDGVARFERHKNRWHEGMDTPILDTNDYSKIGIFATP